MNTHLLISIHKQLGQVLWLIWWPLISVLCVLYSADTLAEPTVHIPRLETVSITATRDARALRELAASIAVISEDELQQIGAVHVSEALNRSAGVWVSRGNGQEHLTAIRSPVLTGAGSCGAFAISEDGVPVRATGFCNVNQLFDINSEQAGQIDILRGPGTVLYGSDAQHGVINVLSLAPAESNESTFALEVGANDYRRVKFSTSDSTSTNAGAGTNSGAGKHGYRINFNGARDGGYKHDSGFDQQKLTARHDYSATELSVRSLLSLNNLNQETAGYISGKDAYKDTARKRENPDPQAFRDSQSARIQTRIEKDLTSAGTLIATPYARYTSMEFLMHFLPGTPLEQNGQRSIGMQSAYHQSLSAQLDLISGIDFELTEAWLQQSQQVGFSSYPAGKQYDFEVGGKLLAAFVHSDYALSADTNIAAGARYEYLQYDYQNRMQSGNSAEDGSQCVNGFTGAIGCLYTRPEDSVDDFQNLSLNLSLLQNFTEQWQGVVRLAHGFRAPQTTEMYRLQNGQMQASLDSEGVDSVELGLRFYADNLQASLTGFVMRKNDVIFQSAERLNLSDGTTSHHGLEYDLVWQINPQWKLGVAGAIARHRYTSDVSAPGSDVLISTDGKDITSAPRYSGSVQLGWRPGINTRAELEWVVMGQYFTDIENTRSYSGHRLLNLGVRQELSPKLSTGVRLRNMANVDYAERADYSSLGGGDRYFIGEPRSALLDVAYSF